MGARENLAAFRLLEDKNRSTLFEKISEHEDITREELSKLVNRDTIDVAADVQVMVALGLMTNHGSGDTAQYKLTDYGHKILKALKENNLSYLDE